MDVENQKSAFEALDRLYGDGALKLLQQKHLAVVGVGGVGSWVAEALARAGVRELSLWDMDEVCVSNINRQLPAMPATVGKSKVLLLKERLESINPELIVHACQEFFTASTAQNFFSKGYDGVVDAIDSKQHKVLLLAGCRERRIATVTVGAGAGRLDPSQIEVKDLAFSYKDPLLREVRKRLRREYHFPQKKNVAFGILSVFSPESLRYPSEVTKAKRLDCREGLGSVCFMTGSLGLMAAGALLNLLLDDYVSRCSHSQEK